MYLKKGIKILVYVTLHCYKDIIGQCVGLFINLKKCTLWNMYLFSMIAEGELFFVGKIRKIN